MNRIDGIEMNGGGEGPSGQETGGGDADTFDGEETPLVIDEQMLEESANQKGGVSNSTIPKDDALANLSYETNSMATAKHLSLFEFGNFKCNILGNQHCQYSPYTGWHLQRSKGVMEIDLSFSNLLVEGPIIARVLLIRKDHRFRAYGIDQICEIHKNEVDNDSQNHVLQPDPNCNIDWCYDQSGFRKSICFSLGTLDPLTRTLAGKISFRSMCFDSCNTCSDLSFSPTESSRDLQLVLTLEAPTCGIIIARKVIDVWPKACIVGRDMNKTERRLPKGGASQTQIQNRKFKAKPPFSQPKKSLSDTIEKIRNKKISKAKPFGSSNQPKMGLTDKWTPFFHSGLQSSNYKQYVLYGMKKVIETETGSESLVGSYNILLTYKNQKAIPPTEVLTKITTEMAIKNAKKLGFSMGLFLKTIIDAWDTGSAAKN